MAHLSLSSLNRKLFFMEKPEPTILRLGSRGSLLARMQSQWVAADIKYLRPGIQIEIKIIKTTGDRITDRPLHDVGGKGLFIKELEQALINGEIDFAVHSYKDVPVTMPLVDVSDLIIAAVPKREDARDVLVASPHIRSIDDLPKGSTVGTGSLRRQCQLLNHRPDLKIVPVRGNIDTRLRKQFDGKLDAIILAKAGLIRANLFDVDTMTEIPIETMVPAAAQGALALQCRVVDRPTRELLELMNDPVTKNCTDIERDVIRMLNANCHSPIGVYAKMTDEENVQVRISIGKEASSEIRNLFVTSHLKNVLADIRKTLASKKIL